MGDHTSSIVTQDPWERLQQFTEARIALGRSGVSLPLQESLAFRLAHARARDAVHQPVQTEAIVSAFKAAGHGVLQLHSKVLDRREYLTRPDRGRILDHSSRALLTGQDSGFDLCLVICDGLSAPAMNESAVAVGNGLLELLNQTRLTAGPVCLVNNGRVAIGDEVGSLLKARMVIVLIGERPGLSSPNSLGAYITYKPVPGTTDEARNCISNIRPGGMANTEAVRKMAYLIEEGIKRGGTGVKLKDKMGNQYVPLLSFM